MIVGLDGRVLLEEFPSGVSQTAREVFQRLIELSPEWKFVLFVSGKNARHLEQRTQAFSHYPNVQIKRVGIPNRLLNLAISIFGWPHLDHLVGGVDVWFSPNIGFVSLRSAPLVLLVHDTTFLTYRSMLKAYTRWWLRCIRPGQLLQKATQIITPSEHSRISILHYFKKLNAEKMTVVPFGPPTPPALNAEQLMAVKNKFQLPNNFSVTIGTLEPRKNLRTLIEAWSADLGQLVVIGAKGWDELPPHPQMRYLGYVTQEEKWAILQQSRAVIYPTVAEGFGLPLLEAFAAGTPVIAGAHTSLVEVGQDAVLWTNVHDGANLRLAVQAIHTDDTMRQLLIQRGRQVLTYFSWEKSILATKQVLLQAYENRN